MYYHSTGNFVLKSRKRETMFLRIIYDLNSEKKFVQLSLSTTNTLLTFLIFLSQ